MSVASIDSTADKPYPTRLADARLVPLWTFFNEWFAAEPRPSAVPYLWRFDALRALLLEAAAVVSTADAERRVLVLENPGLAGRHLAVDALYAGLQLIMPGEHARPHRHTSAALRFMIEGEHTYTSVAGEKAYMQPGDFVVTPNWAWHEHRNEGGLPALWLDVLDVALVRFLGAGFSEHYPAAALPETAPPGSSHFRYGRNLRPVGFRAANASPIFSYPYAYARESLERLAREDLDPCHGVKLEYVDPTTGGPAIPTISTFLQLVPAGFATQPCVTTASTLVAVVEGSGTAVIGAGDAAVTLAFAARDLFVVPSWRALELRADGETILFSASDEAVQRKLGLLRERRGAAIGG